MCCSVINHKLSKCSKIENWYTFSKIVENIWHPKSSQRHSFAHKIYISLLYPPDVINNTHLHSKAFISVLGRNNDVILQTVTKRRFCVNVKPHSTYPKTSFQLIGKDTSSQRLTVLGKLNFHSQHLFFHTSSLSPPRSF